MDVFTGIQKKKSLGMPSHILHLLTPNQRDSENEVYEMESLVKLGELGEATENSEDSFKHLQCIYSS